MGNSIIDGLKSRLMQYLKQVVEDDVLFTKVISKFKPVTVTQRPDVESTHRDNHFDICHGSMLLIWTTSLDSKKQDPCGIVDRTYLLKC